MFTNPHTTTPSIQILLNAPYRKDTEFLKHFIEQERLGAVRELDVSDQIDEVDHTSVLVCSQEAFSTKFLERLKAFLASQPTWAQLPILMVLDTEFVSSQEVVGLRGELSRSVLVVLERPAKRIEISSALRSLIDARNRQLEIRNHIEYQSELQRELNHRLKNTLSTFMAVYRMTIRQSADLIDFNNKFNGRAHALISVQDMLRQAGEANRTVEELCRRVVAPYVDDMADKVEFDKVDMPIASDLAFSLSLILNELATNAVKYGALASTEGKIHVSCRAVDDALIEVIWQEMGGPEVTPPQNESYGSRFIKASATNLGGDAVFAFAKTGLVCKLTLRRKS